MSRSSIVRRASIALSAALVPASLLIGAGPAGAEVPPSYSYSLSSHTKVTDVEDYAHRLGVCVAASNGIECSISKGRSATRTIGTSMGVSTDFVASELNISSSTTQSVDVGCNTVTLRKGQKLEAYPVGSRHKYKIHKRTRFAGGGQSDEYSDYRYTYNPYRTSIACRITS